MKRLFPALCFTLILSCVCSVPSASARDWWWHRHHNSPASEKPKHKEKEHREKARKSWFHHEKASSSGDTASAMTNGPRSIGHRHPMPGPAGAGAR